MDKRIFPHWSAADAGCWCSYLEAMDKNPISTVLAWSDQPGQYAEAVGWQIVGVELQGVVYVTRLHQWAIERSAERGASWSPVNNCTGDGPLRAINYDERRSLPRCEWPQWFCWVCNKP